ncbi:MAG: hypothetical protein GX664_07140, partial [Bacteroidales bacterium]|nr:hypothetical protein [Bacteroidales bacterium]
MKRILYMVFWIMMLILAIGCMILALNSTMILIETWQDLYYLPDDLERSLLVFGLTLFFFSSTVLFLLRAKKMFSLEQNTKITKIGSIERVLKWLVAIWAVLIIIGLAMFGFSFLVNKVFQMGEGPSGLSWYFIFQGSTLVILGSFMISLLSFLEKQ